MYNLLLEIITSYSHIFAIYTCKQPFMMAFEESKSAQYNFDKLIHQFQPETKTLIRKLERTLIKLYRQNVSLLFNEICLNERPLPNYTHTHTHTRTQRFGFFVQCLINLCGLFSAKAILVEYLGNKGVYTFPNGLSLKVNVIVQQEFELAYFEATVQHSSHYTMEIFVYI